MPLDFLRPYTHVSSVRESHRGPFLSYWFIVAHTGSLGFIRSYEGRFAHMVKVWVLVGVNTSEDPSRIIDNTLPSCGSPCMGWATASVTLLQESLLSWPSHRANATEMCDVIDMSDMNSGRSGHRRCWMRIDWVNTSHLWQSIIVEGGLT